MNKIQSMISTVAVPLALLVLGLFAFTGCGERAPQLNSDQRKAFDSASPEVKQLWEKALAADQTNDYVNAAATLDGLKKLTLTDAQSQALDAERIAFGHRLMQAAEKNDPAAIQAVQNSQKNRSPR